MFSGSIHTHSENSRYDSTANVKDLVARAVELGAKSLALTDHGTLIGIWDFMDACQAAGINGVPGVELYVSETGDREHIVLLPKNAVGFQAISKVVTESNYNLQNGKPIANKELLKKWFASGAPGHGNVIATSACVLGVLASALLANETIDEKIGKLQTKLEKEISPDDPIYLDLCLRLSSLQTNLEEMNAEVKEKNLIANKKYVARRKSATKKDDQEELARIDQEEAESKAAAARVAELKKAIAAIRPKISTLKKDKDGYDRTVARYQSYTEQIQTLESQKISYEDRVERAKTELLWYQKLFGKRDFYVELQYHGLKKESDTMPVLASLAQETGTPVVASNDIHLIHKEDAEARAVMFAQKYFWKEIESSERELYMKTDEELSEMLLQILPKEIVDQAIRNIGKILGKCKVEFEHGNHYPKFPCQEGAILRLRRLISLGKSKVEHWSDVYQRRLAYELSVIETMGFSDYLCIVEDFLNYARVIGKLDITSEEFLEHQFDLPYLKKMAEGKVGEGVGPGRGSAAGSLICYLIGITNRDPIKYNLLFERFLNPQRVTMPDIDSDIAIDIRQQVIEYIRHVYGSGAVCQIMTRGYLWGKASIRAAARAYGSKTGNPKRTGELAARISPLIPDAKTRLSQIQDEFNAFLIQLESEADGKAKVEDAKEIFRFATMLEGKLSNIGTHAAGVIISDNNDVSDYIPLMDVGGVIASQCDKDRTESLGCLKMDVLGLKNLSVITDTEMAIFNSVGEKIPFEELPIDDGVFREIFQNGNTDNVFQFESPGMKNMLRQFSPSSMDDLILLVAAYRPGPMQYIPDIISVKNGDKKPEYVIPEMADILDVTYGSPVYQEQLMEIFSRFAGFSLGEADIIRRYMSKKKVEKFMEYKQKFVDGMIARGGDEKAVLAFWDQILNFAEYAFNKSHACAYAYLAYATAYLKHHYPTAYAVGVLNYANNSNDPDKLGLTLKETIYSGIPVAQPYINLATEKFSLRENKVVFGMSSVAGVKNSATMIVKERSECGPFRSFADYMIRTRAKKNVTEALIRAGAFDTMHANRAELLNARERIADIIEKIDKNEKKIEELSMVKTLTSHQEISLQNAQTKLKQLYEELELPMEPISEDPHQRLQDEFEMVGYYLSSHPLDHIQSSVKTHRIRYISSNTNGKPFKVLALVTQVEEVVTKSRGETMLRFSVEDKTGTLECVVFPKTYSTFKNPIQSNKIYFVDGFMKWNDEGRGSFVVNSMEEYKDRLPIVMLSFKNMNEWKLKEESVLPYTNPPLAHLQIFLEDTNTIIDTDYRVDPQIEFANL